MSDDLDRLLPLIDEPASGFDAEITRAEARVWARITGDVTTQAEQPERDDRRPWARALATAAATVVVVAGLAAIAMTRGGSTAPADVTPTTASTAVPGRAEVCARFTSEAGSIIELGDSIVTSEAASTIEGVIAALDRLRADLAAGGAVEQVELDSLDRMRGGITQADLHVRNGDVDAALLALEFATREYTSSSLFADRCLG